MVGESRVIQLQKSLIKLNMNKAMKALNWMIRVMNAENGYARKDGSNYYYHLVDSTQDLINHGIVDEDILTACILHDSIEDIPDVNFELIENNYGLRVANIVDKVTKKDGIDYKDEEGKNIKNYLRIILEDVGACLVKTADRKHNFGTLAACSAKHELRQVKETKEYFIPFAKDARNLYPEYSAYFWSFKTTIMPHLMRIEQAIETENELKEKIKDLENQLNLLTNSK